jgi:CBS domain-containing protein
MTLTTLATWTPEPFGLDATVEHALGRLLDEETGVLPVVDAQGRLAGVVTERVLLEADSPDAPLASLTLAPPLTIAPDAHVFEATRLLVRHDLAAVAVVDEGGQYLGFARRHDIFERFAGMLSTQTPGAVISVEVEPRDYALSQLIYAAEQNGVHVRSITMEPEALLVPVAQARYDRHGTCAGGAGALRLPRRGRLRRARRRGRPPGARACVHALPRRLNGPRRDVSARRLYRPSPCSRPLTSAWPTP